MNPAIKLYGDLSGNNGMNLFRGSRSPIHKKPRVLGLERVLHQASSAAEKKKEGKYAKLREGVVYRLPKGSNKEFIVIVDGHPIRFGDPSMENHEDDADHRKNFRARHSCDEKSDRSKAGFWACKAWESGFKATALPDGVDL